MRRSLLFVGALLGSAVAHAAPYRVRIDSSPQLAAVYVDSKSAGIRGYTPTELEIPEGQHQLILELPGYRPLESPIAVGASASREYTFTLQRAAESPAGDQAPPPPPPGAPPVGSEPPPGSVPSAPTGLRVTSEPSGAQVTVDGRAAGTTPTTASDLLAGEHWVDVRAAGFETAQRQVKLAGGREETLHVALSPIATNSAPVAARSEPAPPSGPQDPRTFTSLGGRAVRRGGFVGDIGVGYPYFLDVRLRAGIYSDGPWGVDGGVEIRSFGQVTDIALQSKFQFVGYDPFYVAIEGALGGGGGPNGRNTFFADLGAAATMSFSSYANFTARTWLDFWTDRLCPQMGDLETTPRSECSTPFQRPNGTFYDPTLGRDNGARWYLGAWVDAALSEHSAIYLALYGVPFQSQRILYTGAYQDVFFHDDPKIYFQIGGSAKF